MVRFDLFSATKSLEVAAAARGVAARREGAAEVVKAAVLPVKKHSQSRRWMSSFESFIVALEKLQPKKLIVWQKRTRESSNFGLAINQELYL